MRFVLGGSDTEMKHIERVLLEQGHEVIKAEIEGIRVTRGQAYRADYPVPRIRDVWVECQHADYTKREMYSLGIDIVDHHYEGDPGYGKPPAEYWEASSIGQVYNLLGLESDYEARMIAAGDHCLYAAYHSMCPGIDKEDCKSYRMSYFGSNSRPKKFASEFGSATMLAKSCETIKLGDLTVVDLTPMTEKHYSWLSDISCLLNMKFATIRPHHKKEGMTKYFVGNLARKEIDYFMNELVPTLGDEVISVYGDPTRQFAGAIVWESK